MPFPKERLSRRRGVTDGDRGVSTCDGLRTIESKYCAGGQRQVEKHTDMKGVLESEKLDQEQRNRDACRRPQDICQVEVTERPRRIRILLVPDRSHGKRECRAHADAPGHQANGEPHSRRKIVADRGHVVDRAQNQLPPQGQLQRYGNRRYSDEKLRQCVQAQRRGPPAQLARGRRLPKNRGQGRP